MEIPRIAIDDVIVPEDHRELRPWKIAYFVEKMKREGEGYNESYPIIIGEPNVLVDGRHRLEAARLVGLTHVPYLLKPEGVSRIRHSIRCNEDGADTEKHDVFDYAQLCWQLSQDGWKGQEIADELEWNTDARVSQYKRIKRQLHPLAWQLARGLNKNSSLFNLELGNQFNRELNLFNWTERYFDALLKHLPYQDIETEDGPVVDKVLLHYQICAVQAILDRYDKGEKVTAEWIGGHCANQFAWYAKAEKYARDALDERVPVKDKVALLRSIRQDVFGKVEKEEGWDKLKEAVASLNNQALGIELYHDDALYRTTTFEDGTVDLVVADPPYNVTDNDWDKMGTDEEYLEWWRQWLGILKPKLAENYHFFAFCSVKYQARVELIIEEVIGPIQTHWVWSHPNISMGRDTKYGAQEKWDMVFHCGTHPLNFPPEWSDNERAAVQEQGAPVEDCTECPLWQVYKGASAVQAHAIPQTNYGDKKFHPTQKPFSLVKLFVELGSKPGDVVLDPFAGGGTTGVACKEIGQRQCILIEKEDRFCKVIEDRLKIKRREA